jgi:alkylation response protein AidB-like acyl-CoA dehydrogenase
MLVRTEPDAPKREGISYLLVSMRQPGVDVRPLKQITGETEFSEVFFTDVRTPADHIVGNRGEGWSVANTTLKHERAFQSDIGFLENLFESMVKLAKRVERDGRPAIEDPSIRERLVELQGWLETQRYSLYIQLSRALKGESAAPLSFTSKLAGTDFGQRIAALAQDLIGDSALYWHEGAIAGERPGNERWMFQFFGSLGNSIAAGASNIHRNIIAERGYGLPRDAYS